MSHDRSPRRRPVRSVLVAAAAALVLAGCAIPLPVLEADPAPTGPQSALDEVRFNRVLSGVADAVAASDEAQDATLLEPRMSGPALQTRTAELALAAVTAGTEDVYVPQTLTTDPNVVAISNSETWPKTAMVITNIAEGMNTPLLIGLQQSDPRSQYQMFSWVRLLPNVTTPAMSVPVQGSPQIASDAGGFVLTPAETVAGYADVLQSGDDSTFAATFAADPFRNLVVADREAIVTSVADAGTYTEAVTPGEFVPVSMGTADGGAIVIGTLNSAQTYTLTEEDGELSVATPDVIALAGETEPIDVTTSLTATYFITVAFYVPPAADGATITVLGAERVLSSVTTS